MSYAEELKLFKAAHKYESITVGGSNFHYILSGKKESKTLVMLNGGMDTSEMWACMLFLKIGVTKPIFGGASDVGMVAQIYT